MNETILVLVVDYDTSIQSIVQETLSDGGFEPTIASTGEEAAVLLKANKYRAIVIDIAFGRDRDGRSRVELGHSIPLTRDLDNWRTR